jgi:hypothetical protein
MDSILEHNHNLQQTGTFSASDLGDNQVGKFSPAQLKRFEEEREFIRQSAVKYNNKSPLISLIFFIGLIGFTAVLYFVGVLDILQDILGGLFLPVLAGGFVFAALLIFVVIPRQYQSSVDTFQAMGTPLAQSPLGSIQVIEARAHAYHYNDIRRPHYAHDFLEMESIKFSIASSLYEVLQSKRLYRAYAVQDQGAWMLLSIEALE